jgi:predicted YcjX-like family ATPase
MSSTGSRERTLVVGQTIAGHLHHDDYQLGERLSQRLIVRAKQKNSMKEFYPICFHL